MSDYSNNYAFYLFAKPSLLEGVGRIFDFNNILETYNSSKNEQEADSKATQLDWMAVGQDIQSAFNQYGK